MGRAASHITLECALQTQPNICIISEEVEEKQISLSQIVEGICISIIKRSENKENYGVILIPEGLVEFIPEIKKLIDELNDVLGTESKEFNRLGSFVDQLSWLSKCISPESYRVLQTLPPEFSQELLMDRDPHGNVMVSRIETEKLLIGMVEKRLAKLKEEGSYKGSFSPLGHFFGYEGRCAFPSNFDTDYCYSLGYCAFLLIASGLTGYIAGVKNLVAAASNWIAGGVPLTMMMNLEQRHGLKKPVIKKALVDLNGAPFKAFDSIRDTWAVKTCYLFPGSIQYFGPSEVCDEPTKTLKLEHGKS
jgi:pyrophosphate--fructose-6-phosphate 1-phosphotransferase